MMKFSHPPHLSNQEVSRPSQDRGNQLSKDRALLDAKRGSTQLEVCFHGERLHPLWVCRDGECARVAPVINTDDWTKDSDSCRQQWGTRNQYDGEG